MEKNTWTNGVLQVLSLTGKVINSSRRSVGTTGLVIYGLGGSGWSLNNWKYSWRSRGDHSSSDLPLSSLNRDERDMMPSANNFALSWNLIPDNTLSVRPDIDGGQRDDRRDLIIFVYQISGNVVFRLPLMPCINASSWYLMIKEETIANPLYIKLTLVRSENFIPDIDSHTCMQHRRHTCTLQLLKATSHRMIITRLYPEC